MTSKEFLQHLVIHAPAIGPVLGEILIHDLDGTHDPRSFLETVASDLPELEAQHAVDYALAVFALCKEKQIAPDHHASVATHLVDKMMADSTLLGIVQRAIDRYENRKCI